MSNQNTSYNHKLNKVGYRGVTLNANKYNTQINVDKKSIYLGRFDNPYDAAIAAVHGRLKHMKYVVKERELELLAQIEKDRLNNEGKECLEA
jgi:hypothetical protein